MEYLICGLVFVSVAVWITLGARATSRDAAARQQAFELQYPIGAELVFRGRFFAHWELASFQWDLDGDARPSSEDQLRCVLETDPEKDWSWLDKVVQPGDLRHSAGEVYQLEFKGRLLERGSFGHMGFCGCRVKVLEIISIKHIADPEGTSGIA